MKTRILVSAALLSVATELVALPAPAHHSFAPYEETRIRTLEGTVRNFQWTNPHVLLTVMARSGDLGQPQEWVIVTSGPAILRRFGWRRNSMKSGDRVRLVCNPLRNGSRGCRLHTLTLLDTGQILKTKLATSTDSPR